VWHFKPRHVWDMDRHSPAGFVLAHIPNCQRQTAA
jgi:hypothetical protein